MVNKPGILELIAIIALTLVFATACANEATPMPTAAPVEEPAAEPTTEPTEAPTEEPNETPAEVEEVDLSTLTANPWQQLYC